MLLASDLTLLLCTVHASYFYKSDLYMIIYIGSKAPQAPVTHLCNLIERDTYKLNYEYTDQTFSRCLNYSEHCTQTLIQVQAIRHHS